MKQKKRPTPTNGKPSALDGAIVAHQQGDGKSALRLSPRHARVIQALLPGNWMIREALDRVAGSSNGPDVIYQLRGKFGHDAIESERVDAIDRDGKACQVGRYRLTQQGRERLAQINATTDQGSAAA